MAELADAYGSGPYGGNFMQVQVLFPAPRSAVVHDTMGYRTFLFFCRRSSYSKQFSEHRGVQKSSMLGFFYFTEGAMLIFALHPLMGKIKK